MLNYLVFWIKGVVLYIKNCVGCYCMLVIEFVIIFGLFIDVKYFHRILQLLLIIEFNSMYYSSDINMRKSVNIPHGILYSCEFHISYISTYTVYKPVISVLCLVSV